MQHPNKEGASGYIESPVQLAHPFTWIGIYLPFLTALPTIWIAWWILRAA